MAQLNTARTGMHFPKFPRNVKVVFLWEVRECGFAFADFMLRSKSQGEQKATLEMENYEGLLEVTLVSKAKHRNQESFLLFFSRLILPPSAL